MGEVPARALGEIRAAKCVSSTDLHAAGVAAGRLSRMHMQELPPCGTGRRCAVWLAVKPISPIGRQPAYVAHMLYIKIVKRKN